MAGETEHTGGTPLLKPETTAAELEKLAQAEDKAVRAAVAAHPNTPSAVLGTLAPEFPSQVLGNPALPLLRLANPRLLLDWSDSAVLALVRQPHSPAWLRKIALEKPRPEFQVAVATHPNLTPEEVMELAVHPAWLVRARIAARPDLEAAQVQRLAADADYGVRLAVAAREDLSLDSVERLSRDPSRFVRQVLQQTRRRPG